MCAGDRPEGENQGDKHSAGCQGIGKQRNRGVAASQAFAYDAGTYHGD